MLMKNKWDRRMVKKCMDFQQKQSSRLGDMITDEHNFHFFTQLKGHINVPVNNESFFRA